MKTFENIQQIVSRLPNNMARNVYICLVPMHEAMQLIKVTLI